MATQIEILNAALVQLGAAPLASPADDSDHARAAALLWPIERDACLREFPWGFATARYKLAEASPGPVHTWLHAYTLPGEVLFVREVEDERDPWVLEAGQILTDLASPLAVVTTIRVEVVERWDASFASAFALRLAWKLAYAVTRSRTVAADMAALYLQAIPRAKTRASQEGVPAARGDGDDLVRVR